MGVYKKTIIVSVAIAVIIFCIGCAQNNDESGSTSDLPTIVGYVMEGIDVPEEVLSAAKKQTAEIFDMTREDFPDYNYTNWRIESLKYSYAYLLTDQDKAIIYSDAYKATNGVKIDIYQMNYELFTKSPENIMLAGGMYITEDNWVMPDYPNSRFLVFEQDGDKLTYLFTMMENDCYPGDDIFTEDLLKRLKEMQQVPQIGIYRIVSDEGFCRSSVTLKENNEFEFNRDIAMSYLPMGTYSVENGRLKLMVTETESYIFTIEGDKLIFESGLVSDNIVKKGTIYILSED